MLELDGGQLIGRDAGFAVEKLAGSLAMDGDIQIQGKLGGLLLHTGTTGQEVAPDVSKRQTFRLPRLCWIISLSVMRNGIIFMALSI